MKHMFLIFALFIVVVGCESTNPLCTENYCVEGTIYPKSDLADGQEYGELSNTESCQLTMPVSLRCSRLVKHL